jgi:hypothetical protein
MYSNVGRIDLGLEPAYFTRILCISLPLQNEKYYLMWVWYLHVPLFASAFDLESRPKPWEIFLRIWCGRLSLKVTGHFRLIDLKISWYASCDKWIFHIRLKPFHKYCWNWMWEISYKSFRKFPFSAMSINSNTINQWVHISWKLFHRHCWNMTYIFSLKVLVQFRFSALLIQIRILFA